MRLAFILSRFPVLSETFVLNQLTGLLDRGHEIEIYAWTGETDKVHRDVEQYNLMGKVRYWPSRPAVELRILKAIGLVAGNLRSLKPALRSLSGNRFGGDGGSLRLLYTTTTVAGRPAYDVILCHFGRVGRDALFLRDVGALGGKLVTIFHGADMSRFLIERGEGIYDDLLERGDLFLPISHHWKKRLVELGATSEKVIVHRMGIDCNRFEFKARTPPEDGLVRLISIARLVEKKGIEYGIRAVAALARTGRNVAYTIVGDGPLRKDTEQLIEKLGMGERITLSGWMTQDELVAVMDKQHILLTPSVTAASGDMEGIPVALMEAMAIGFPVVSTFHSGIPELVVDGKTGHLVAERDVDALTKALDGLVTNPERWAEMGRAGREVVEREFNIDHLNDRLVELLQEL